MIHALHPSPELLVYVLRCVVQLCQSLCTQAGVRVHGPRQMLLESLRVVFMLVVAALLHEELEPLIKLVSGLVDVFLLILRDLWNVSVVVALAWRWL